MVAHNKILEQAMEEARSSVPKLVVPAELLVAEKIHHMVTGLHRAQEEAAKVQLELNLQIVELRLKAPPSTPPEVKEKCDHTIQSELEVIEHVVHNCTGLLDQSLLMLTSL